jgi:Domain of unknown function (DUF4232)
MRSRRHCSRCRRRVVFVARAPIAAAGLLGCGGKAAGGMTRTTGGAAPGHCDFRVKYAAGQGATGHIFTVFTVETSSLRGCVLRGYPRVTLLDRHHGPLPTRASRDRLMQRPVRNVLVRRGKGAQFNLVIYEWHDLSGRHLCRPIPAAVRVRLPGDRRALIVPVQGRSPNLRVFTPCRGEFGLSPVYRYT